MFGKFNEPTRLYAQACCEVAKEMGSDLVDFYTAMSKQEVIENIFLVALLPSLHLGDNCTCI